MNTEHFKAKLEEELRVAERQIGENAAAPRREDASATESDELADKVESLEEENEENAALKARLGDIKRALGKIADGTYGICEISGENIEEDRLEANPAARTCKEHMDSEGTLA
ncbi:MAG TPA: TraR/DksA C4-type zinc finger protein [Candidatus Paceibacterota bacterium]|nr:TraR/DksA C4-type zinc finger protein [Candidatus Paceibacterota bacterium]